MKKLLIALFAAFVIGGVVHAEVPEGRGDPSVYRVYRGTDPAAGASNPAKSSFIHKVIVSSPSNVDYSTWSVLSVYNSQGSNTNKMFDVQLSSNEVTGAVEWTFDVFAASGLRVNHSTGDATASDIAGKVSVIFSNPAPGYRVWKSSYMAIDTSTHTIAKGPVLLHKISVLKKSLGTSPLDVYNGYSTSVVATKRNIRIDMADTAREYVFNTVLSSGITVAQTGDTAGTAGEFMIFYESPPPQDYEIWESTCVTGTITNSALFAGNGTFGGVVITSASATSHLKVYNANGTANNQITEIDGMTTKPRIMFDVEVSSGLTVTSAGNAKFTVLYRRRR